MKKRIFLSITLAALLASVALLFTRYIDSLLRILTAVLDLCTSVVYYFSSIFLGREPSIVSTVNTVPNVDLQKFIPFDLEEVHRKWLALGDALWKKYYFVSYLRWLTESFRYVSILLMLIVPLFILLGALFRSALLQEKLPEVHGKDSRPLIYFKKKVFPIYFKVKGILLDYKAFLAERPKIWKFFIFIWICNLNMLTILIEFLAFYFYFAAVVEFGDFPTQLFKLLIDLIIMFAGAPFIFWAVVGFLIFDYVRRQIGYAVLNAHEAANRAFIDDLPIVCMLCGSMGTGKTTMLVDMTLSQSVMFRDKAHRKMLEYQARLPNFPWILLEDEILYKMQYRHNLAMIRAVVKYRKKMFERTGDLDYLFGYDVASFRTSYDDSLKITDVWEFLETYAQLFYIYVSSSLVVGNLSVRQDELLQSIGNFPVWECEFFDTDPVSEETKSIHSYVIDFDMLRPGKRVIADNPNYGAFEYGVIDITEVGKERGNNLELRETKKNTGETNQKNDNMNQWIKMCRHAATVDHYPFVRIITDEQRPESWGADARDLSAIVHIVEKESLRLAMPGFLFGDILYDLIAPKWNSFYTEYRFARGDDTLTMFLLRNVVTAFLRHHERIYNRFGYHRLRVETERGTMDAERVEHEYFISTKKTYAKRYATDCFSDYYAKKAIECRRGLRDLPQYETERASFEELKKQNSYFIKSLLGEEEKEKE